MQTELGCALPPASRHAITFHLPQWSSLVPFIEKDQVGALNSGYPHMLWHDDVKDVINTREGQTAFIFTSSVSAAECKEYGTAADRGKENMLSPEDISIRVFDVKGEIRLYVVIFPESKLPILHPFWQVSGRGISSRLAEECLKNIETLREITEGSTSPIPTVKESEAHSKIRDRIAKLLERAPIGAPRRVKVAPEDVYLFPSGTAAIYSVHRHLLEARCSNPALFGFAFHNTLQIFDFFQPGYKLFGRGTDDELVDLEEFLEAQKEEGENGQAIWAEFPSNPLLTAPQLNRLRELADKYGSLLIVDDTIGGFCNVDLLSDGADMIITSLTRAFSGHADVMGASVVLNPASHRYSELKDIFNRHFVNDYYTLDAIAMEKNSRDYLARSAILNANSLALVKFLDTKAKDPNSTVRQVDYPTTSSSVVNYTAYMRPGASDFKPGYGYVFTVEFESIEATQAFYDNLDTHKGPHIGAHLTIALPYVRFWYSGQLEWVEKFGMRETQVRISPGLEDTGELVEVFKAAVMAADEIEMPK
ncbi:uncharacterized protein BP5553_06636 [Venustampulla echinocandica]|uniref:PLP-dependent transferase n=1 Tax=Venustampulla echinocandica TaxID=2656787 RepID=A0A370TKH6_9HELO|nr:uncharacterized protein BP5553_06636 [Venustampulla echinocandica]RDL36024.1 hypothetical protein BP5553_06636 [Venustampulla echinocandica]